MHRAVSALAVGANSEFSVSKIYLNLCYKLMYVTAGLFGCTHLVGSVSVVQVNIPLISAASSLIF